MSDRGCIDIDVQREKLTSRYLIAPNDLHCGRGVYAGLGLAERGMLAALLSLGPKWTTSRRALAQLAPGTGRDAMSQILDTLCQRGFLVRRKINAGGGRFRWIWTVSMTPSGRAPVDGGDVDGPDQHDSGVCPAQPSDGMPGTGEPSTLEVRDEEPEKDSPPTPRASADAATPSGDGGQGDDATGQTIAAVRAHQPGWRPPAIAQVLTAARHEQGRDTQMATTALVDLAAGVYGTTHSPRRLLADGPWWTRRPVAAGPDLRPRCPHHPGQLAHACAACAGERHHPVSVAVAEGDALTRDDARSAAMAAASWAQRARARRSGRLAVMAE
jgi:hypothetical protein